MARLNKALILVLCLAVMLAVPAWPYSFQQGEAGIQIIWQPNQQNGGRPSFNLNGSTVSFIYRSGPLPAQATLLPLTPPSQVRTCTILNGGMTAIYIISSTDFVLPGTYHVQFMAYYNGQVVRKSSIQTVTVNPSLG